MLRLYTVLLLSSILLYSTQLRAQDNMSTKLNNWARSSERSEPTQEIWLQFDHQLDYEALDKEFRIKNYSLEQRAEAVINLSQDMHASSLNQLEQWIDKGQVREDFWLGNSVIVQLDKNEVLELSAKYAVRWMELTSENQIEVEDVEMELPVNEKDAINGAELGLKVINAHKMWARGYSGKGRKALIVDTGVWPGHPAIADAWVGQSEPAQRSWYGFDSHVPKDKGNSHGTHVTGTVLGLDPANNDTIGVAFDARFMAADPVATQISERKGLYSTVRAYQWVLDPDGFGTSSNYKLPDVINNSWGRSTQDSPDICTNPFGDAVAACQLAGIAVVWSAGNNGPGTNTIGAPATITRNPYLVFTVGAVNGNTQGYPIASFSSRGPSYCAQVDIDSIKPEVVAPGVAVRSSVGQDSYASYQGTSMAGPHVAGAVLLLKEAFPNLPGEDLLEALYLTASDLGPLGEDIAYGNGMIDVDGAFLWLSTKHVASIPLDFSQDVSVELVSISDSLISCANEIEAEFKIINHSDSIIDKDTLLITAFQDGGQSGTVQGPQRLVKDLNPGDSVTIKIKYSNSSKQNTEFGLRIANGLPENNDPFNDKAYAIWKNIGEESIPFSDDFSINKTKNWIVDNPDNDYTWSVRVWEENGKSNEALQLDFFNTNQRRKEQDFLISPKFLVEDNAMLQISFDYAYASKRMEFFKDSLSLEVTTVCNSNWKSIWAKKGGELATAPDTIGVFVPLKGHWESVTIDLSQYDNEEFIQLRFVGTSGFGNNLYIDNVTITSLQPTSVDRAYTVAEIEVFPNPSKGLLELSGNLTQFNRVSLVDISGKLVMESRVQKDLDISSLENGIYILELVGDSQVFKTKIVKE